ncbi:MAG: carbohydrate kinase family protein [Candidatus Wildermuthbacteria bacterium]|nr:carbohydrate kinase family protein [Candidatus Wildermuthbacteria bacterium]
MKPKFDLISVGDTQYDVFLELEEETKVLKDPESGMEYLGLVFAEKIPAKSYKAVPAVGNSANVAIGASRLGLKSAFYTHLGKDYVGEEEMKVFKQEKVSSDYIVWDKKHGSNFSAVLNYKGERTIIVHHEPRDYDLPNCAPASWMYFSSLAPGHEKLHTQIPEYVKKYKAKLGFNPGSFQLQEGFDALRSVLETTAVFFVNKEEAKTLLGNSDDVKELLSKLKDKGPKIVVITDGMKGSYCFDGTSFYHLGIFQVPLVEMTGAGDAYSTGFISAIAKGKDVKEAMKWGAANAASVIQKIGAREGLLHEKEMQKFLDENPNPELKMLQ